MKKQIKEKDFDKLKSNIELLDAIHKIEYHNKNWLPIFYYKNKKAYQQEKMNLIKNCLDIIGPSASQPHT